MKELILDLMKDKRIAILGFGREGLSSYLLLRRYLPEQPLWILDANPEVAFREELKEDNHLQVVTGSEFLSLLPGFDLVIKSPGVPSYNLPSGLDPQKITSQTDLFLRQYHKQVIGVTGTKGKSTTSSLIHHVFKTAGYRSLLLGNIGLPPFEGIEEIKADTLIVMELSSHQLEFIRRSPRIAILLNIFQEHLDHYKSYEHYQEAKLNIGKYQERGDFFLYNANNVLLHELIDKQQPLFNNALPFSLKKCIGNGVWREAKEIFLRINNEERSIFNLEVEFQLPGEHNLSNIMAAAAAASLAGLPTSAINTGVGSFKGLEHRLEYVGEYNGIKYYNDSIATIPEATIEAVKTLKLVDTLILGGFDRGIDYSALYPFLEKSGIRNLIFIGNAGQRMKSELEKSGFILPGIYLARDYDEVVDIARRVTQKGMICLLSPAASSYDMFKNFEHRGAIFKKNVRS